MADNDPNAEDKSDPNQFESSSTGDSTEPEVEDELPASKGVQVSRGLQQRNQDELERSQIYRHKRGTEQVDHILRWGHISAASLIAISAFLAVSIFWMGFHALVNGSVAGLKWQSYLLVFIPTTLFSLLGITIWITSLKFSAQIYASSTEGNGSQDNGKDSEALTECAKALTEVTKHLPGG